MKLKISISALAVLLAIPLSSAAQDMPRFRW